MLIIEGIDGVGKTTLVEYLESCGMKKSHFDYDSKNMDLLTKYMSVLLHNENDLVLDRSFISEMTYGPVIRNDCKLSIEDYTKLLIAYNNAGTKIIYLTAPKDVLLSRRNNDLSDFEVISKHYEKLNNKYEEIMQNSSDFIEVIKIDTSKENIHEVRNHVRTLVKK